MVMVHVGAWYNLMQQPNTLAFRSIYFRLLYANVAHGGSTRAVYRGTATQVMGILQPHFAGALQSS